MKPQKMKTVIIFICLLLLANLEVFAQKISRNDFAGVFKMSDKQELKVCNIWDGSYSGSQGDYTFTGIAKGNDTIEFSYQRGTVKGKGSATFYWKDQQLFVNIRYKADWRTEISFSGKMSYQFSGTNCK